MGRGSFEYFLAKIGEDYLQHISNILYVVSNIQYNISKLIFESA